MLAGFFPHYSGRDTPGHGVQTSKSLSVALVSLSSQGTGLLCENRLAFPGDGVCFAKQQITERQDRHSVGLLPRFRPVNLAHYSPSASHTYCDTLAHSSVSVAGPTCLKTWALTRPVCQGRNIARGDRMFEFVFAVCVSVCDCVRTVFRFPLSYDLLTRVEVLVFLVQLLLRGECHLSGYRTTWPGIFSGVYFEAVPPSCPKISLYVLTPQPLSLSCTPVCSCGSPPK